MTEILKTLTIILSAVITRYRNQLEYSCHSYYEVSHFEEKEKNGSGQRISGTAPGRPARAKIFLNCVRTPR